MMSRVKRVALMVALLCGVATQSALADDTEVEKEYQYRMGIEMDWTLAKGLKLSVSPEMRFGDGGFSFEQFQAEAGLRYKTFGFLYWGVDYRLIFRPSEDVSSYYGSNGPEVDSRYGFSLTAKEKFGRFTPSFRIMYSNYTDDDNDGKVFMRYKAAVKYNIRKSPISPYVAVEAYQNLEVNLLHKMRYSTGFDLKVKKDRYLSFDYKFDFYTLAYKNRNIFSVGYKVSF
ncbi:MAG: DUF2490 domain-containing protein [Rikenellaceae bacterium]